MMMRVVAQRPLVAALMPLLRDAAARHRGEPFTLGFTSADGEQVTLDAGASSARVTRATPAYRLDADASLAVLLGGARASSVVRPRPLARIARRIDALLPEVAMHFWNADRI
jgi:hypothetical protein